MRWIIEAGTTKTDSVILSQSGPLHRKTSPGLNPVSDSNFRSKLTQLCKDSDLSQVEEVYYYGSGCINDELNRPIQTEILSFLKEGASIAIEDDLLGAAISTCRDEPGITAILGTGSNIGYYDGSIIRDRIPSCGYLLGDEGGGYRIGQAIFLRYCRGFLTSDEMALIESESLINIHNAVGELYKNENPRQYLATFSKYITMLSDSTQDEVLGLVFSDFCQNMALPMWNRYHVPISLVGSISFHFKDRLMHIFDNFNIIAGSNLKSPIEGLIKYHSYE